MGNTLVGYVVGNKPFFLHLKSCVSRLWKPTCSLEIFSRKNGFFFFKFSTQEECERIFHGGPWLFDGRLIILKKWSESTSLERDLLASIPVWVRFPSLHLKFWSQKVLSKASSLIGKPLYMDKATTSGEILAYARCFVEISASKKLPNHVVLDLEDGERVSLPVIYEWVPPLCQKCVSFGHVDTQCPTNKV